VFTMTGPLKDAGREARLAHALRANLRRRKAPEPGAQDDQAPQTSVPPEPPQDPPDRD